MFKDRAVQVKMVKTTEPEATDENKKSHLTESEIQLVKDVVIYVGKLYLARLAVDSALKFYLGK